jgi:hypothetical protein
MITVFCAPSILAQGTAFTYQGRLNGGGTPANGSYDLQFTLWDALSGGTQQPQPSPVTLTLTGVSVTAGSFTVSLDFGASAFPGASRFLEISVRRNGSGSFTTLSPRTEINSTPYAIRSLNSTSADALSSACAGCVQDSNINSVAGSKLNGTILTASVPAGSGNYIQNQQASVQQANFLVSGNGMVGGQIGVGTTVPLGKLQAVTDNDTNPESIFAWDTRHFVVGARTSGGIGMSYDQTNNVGYLEALSPSTAWRNLVLQSGGGNVGIGTGTTAPHGRLEVAGNGASVVIGDPNCGAGSNTVAIGFLTNASLNCANNFNFGASTTNKETVINRPTGGRISFREGNGTDQIRIAPGGNVGIGTTDYPPGRLTVVADSHFGDAVVANSSFGNGVDSTTSYSGSGVYGNTGSANKNLDAGVYGRANDTMGVWGESSTWYGVQGSSLSGEGVFGISNSGNGVAGYSSTGNAGYFNGNVLVIGNLTVNGTFSNPSDLRLKNHIAPLNYGLREIMQLRPVSYTWKERPERGVQVGLIGQELEPVLPELVTTAKDAERTKGINYIGLLPVVIKAIQEQQATITALKAENAELKQQNATAHKDNAALKTRLDREQHEINALKKLILASRRHGKVCR